MKYELDLSFLENSTETLRAIAHPLRLAIIEVLHQNKRMSVTEIYEQLDIEQAVASHHLRILKDKDVVLVRREGKNSYYTLVSSSFYDILQLLKNN
jgi:ArsR family transcriptional regulator